MGCSGIFFSPKFELVNRYHLETQQWSGTCRPFFGRAPIDAQRRRRDFFGICKDRLERYLLHCCRPTSNNTGCKSETSDPNPYVHTNNTKYNTHSTHTKGGTDLPEERTTSYVRSCSMTKLAAPEMLRTVPHSLDDSPHRIQSHRKISKTSTLQPLFRQRWYPRGSITANLNRCCIYRT